MECLIQFWRHAKRVSFCLILHTSMTLPSKTMILQPRKDHQHGQTECFFLKLSRVLNFWRMEELRLQHLTIDQCTQFSMQRLDGLNRKQWMWLNRIYAKNFKCWSKIRKIQPCLSLTLLLSSLAQLTLTNWLHLICRNSTLSLLFWNRQLEANFTIRLVETNQTSFLMRRRK